MLVTGESRFISVKAGQKNGKDWFMVKFLDENADEFFTAFINEDLYRDLEGVAKKTPVVLTLQLVPGQKYFTVESIEVVE